MRIHHRMPIEIGFKHCDPAAIVFYPRFVEMINDTVEHWFRYGLKLGFDELHVQRRLGVPTVNLQVEFLRPARLGELLAADLEVLRLGRSSLELAVRLCGPQEGDVRVSAKVVLVCVSLETMKAASLPEQTRASIEAMMA